MTMRHRRLPALLFATGFWLIGFSLWADEPLGQAPSSPNVNERPSADAAKEVGRGRALIVCGLSGDTERHKIFAETTAKLHAAMVSRFGVNVENVELLFGDEPQTTDPEVIKSSRRATREELEKAAASICQNLHKEDTLWVVVVGHCHYDGRHAWLNLPGPDLQQFEFAKLFEGVVAARQVFILTTSTSGIFIKPLSSKQRIIITATEADWETNETEFPHELARLLSEPPSTSLTDVDEDGVISLFDLYITVSRNLAQSYVERELLATEHALLDDNGDGRGTELQIDYLTVEQGGRLKPNKPSKIPSPPNADGRLAKLFALPRFSPLPPK